MRVVLRDWLHGVVILGLAAGVVSGQEIGFTGDPVLGHETIRWSWEALAGRDPYFQGNTVLEKVGDRTTSVPGAFRILESNSDGTIVFAVSENDDTVYVIDGTDGHLLDTLPPPPSPLLDLEVHRSNELVFGGLQDGRVAVWDRRVDATHELIVYAAQSKPCRFVKLLAASTSPDDQRLVTAGDEDTVRVWNSPGSLLREIRTSGRWATAIDLTDSGSLLAVGDSLGTIRVYEPTGGAFKQRLEGHSSPINRLIFSADQKVLVSTDDTGRVLRWNTKNWSKGSLEIFVDETDATFFGIRQPDAALFYASDPDTFRIYDGLDGRIYRSADLVPEGTHEAGTMTILGRAVVLGLSGGVLRVYRTGYCTPSPNDSVCFGGYKVWRSETPEGEDAVLLRVYGFGDSTWSFRGPERAFVDPDSLIPRGGDEEEPLAGPHDGYPYYYSLTAFERRYLNGAVFEVLLNSIDDGFYTSSASDLPTPVYAHASERTAQPLLGNVIVVPNPYKAGEVPWNAQLGEHVEFRNLPGQASIRIYTVSGDLLRTIEHGPGTFGESTDTRAWDLKNGSGERVASGVYIYHITTTLSSDEATGYFIIVR